MANLGEFELMRCQVAIIGAGPAGLLLAHLLHAQGVDAVVLESRDLAYVKARVRAGVLEQTTVDVLEKLGVGGRMRRDGIVHTGTNIVIDGEIFRIDMAELTNGASVMVYGQQEVVRDLLESGEERGIKIIFEAQNVQPHDVTSARPSVSWTQNGEAQSLECDFIVGCDGYHGVARGSIPDDVLKIYERVYPFGWLGILADVPPANHELIYANHEHGFALASMRSPTRSRYYIQCAVDENIADWPDERFWDELCVRLGPQVAPHVVRGASFEKSIAPLRSFVAEPMRYGQLFLAGDAAHIVPPTGAKGMNLAVSDVTMLGEAFGEYYLSKSSAGIEHYSQRALARVWKAERFSWWFTSITHRFPEMDSFGRKMQVAELNYIRGSRAAQTTLAENYVGLKLN